MHLPFFFFFFPLSLDMKTSASPHSKLRMCLKSDIKKNILCSVFFVSTVILFCPRIFYFLRAFVFASYRFSSHKTKTQTKMLFRKKIIMKVEELRYKVYSRTGFLLSSFLSVMSCSIGPLTNTLLRHRLVKILTRYCVCVGRTRKIVNKGGNM